MVGFEEGFNASANTRASFVQAARVPEAAELVFGEEIDLSAMSLMAGEVPGRIWELANKGKDSAKFMLGIIARVEVEMGRNHADPSRYEPVPELPATDRERILTVMDLEKEAAVFDLEFDRLRYMREVVGPSFKEQSTNARFEKVAFDQA